MHEPMGIVLVANCQPTGCELVANSYSCTYALLDTRLECRLTDESFLTSVMRQQVCLIGQLDVNISAVTGNLAATDRRLIGDQAQTNLQLSGN